MLESCVCDAFGDGGADFIEEKVRRARKKHRCYECGEWIEPGQKYEHAKICSDGTWFKNKTCMPCRNMRNSLMKCWTYGRVHEELYYHYGFWPAKVPEE